VRVSAITKPLVEGIETADEFIAYAARVSNPTNQLNTETAPNLIAYLIKNSHWSPLEMVSATLEIETTRDISHQIVRHRSFAFQEFSQRYADVSVMGHTKSEVRLQDTKNRQNSIETHNSDLHDWWSAAQGAIWDLGSAIYETALAKGIAKELARKVLPEGITNSRLYMSGTLRSWYHYTDLRSANGTQKEHKIIAVKAREVLAPYFPSIFNNPKLLNV
jgi:thymidylate synthase (FAD)